VNITINWIEAFGYFGALLTICTYSMKRMIPLRVIGMCANCVLIVYGVLTPVDLNMECLKPFMSKRACKAGELIFRKGDVASAMFYTVSGRYRLDEIAADVVPGQVIGEIGLVAPDNKRTMTFECVEEGELLTISYSAVKQLYFQNPKFGFYFLQLISHRLFRDIARLEERLARPA
jgi:hypothetical protein